jgi:hypothetical protein
VGYYNHWILNQQVILNYRSKIKKTRARAKIVANSQVRARTHAIGVQRGVSRADAPGQGALTAYRSLSRLRAQPAHPCCLRAQNATGHAREECYEACARRMLRGMRAQNYTGHARAECYGACARRMQRGMRVQNATGHARVGSNTWICRH